MTTVRFVLAMMVLGMMATPVAAEEAMPVPPPPPLSSASVDGRCDAAVSNALADLKGVVRVDPSEEPRVADILAQLCESALSQLPAAAPAGASTESDSTNILGVEIRKAPPGADGYERTRK